MTPIKHIEEELADCRAAFAAHPEATRAWCCHHAAISEWLTEPFENRIKYILSDKPEYEQAIRFRNFRPVINTAAIAEAWKVYDAAVDEASKARAAAINEAWEARAAAIDEARKVYEAARNEAYKVRDAARNEAWKVYEAARNEAYKVYDAARNEARKVFNAAVDEASKARAAAINEAWKVYDAALLPLLNQEWPDNTWKDGSIFTKCASTAA